MSEKDTEAITVDKLPITFQVKYLGQHDAGGLWGIKHTRRPVDNMVACAKNIPTGQILPIVKLHISTEGVQIQSINQTGSKSLNNADVAATFTIDSISYGVQDLVYTRVFSMIVVKEGLTHGQIPFMCHAFVCESRSAARCLTYALAAAFQEYSRQVKEKQAQGEKDGEPPAPSSIKKKFAIDLRTPEEIEADLEAETEA